jgi:SanA protein
LADAKMTAAELEKVILVGGPTRMPVVFDFVKKILLAIIGIVLLVIVIFTVSYLVINLSTRSYIYTDADKLPHAQVAIVPGAAILINGGLSPVLRDRVDMAIAIYRQGIVDKILVTGDNSSLEYNEVGPMKKYLLRNAIPEQDIFLDHAGFDTYSSMYRARDVIQVKSMIVVSQAFHLPRAVYIARSLGVSAYGMSADRGRYLFYNYVREMFGDVKAMSNLIFGRQPKYLGTQIPITGDGRNVL